MREALISVCIPTFKRARLLRQAIECCFGQDYRPLEILVGDDSDDDESERMVRSLDALAGVTLRYERNVPGLGQALNVNRLFDRASGERLLLLHDDDLLCDGALTRLEAAWSQWPGAQCVYGRQIVMDEAGETLAAETELWNQRYFRVSERAGRQDSPLAAALLQQIPNNGYLLSTALARAIRCKPESEVGHCIDAEFVIRIAKHAKPGAFVFIDANVSKYRLTSGSIARSSHLNRRQDRLFEIVAQIDGKPEVHDAKDIILSRIAVGAALDAAMARRPALALRILFSRYYDRPFFSRWTAYRLVCSLSPKAGVAMKGWFEPVLRPRA